MYLHTRLAVLGFFLGAGSVASVSVQQEYEWVSYGRVAQYAQDIAFSLVSFTVPPRTLKAEFHVVLSDDMGGGDRRKVLLSLRRKGIPVLQAYNETVPDFYILPSDQQAYMMRNETAVSLTLNSPAPGRVYLVATELNPLSEVVDYLQWGQRMSGETEMSVTAQYTTRTSVSTIPVEEVTRVSSAEGLKQTYSFRIPAFTMSYSVLISNCRHSGSRGNCPVTMTAGHSLAVDDKASVSVDCRRQRSQCLLTVSSPVLEQDHYITFSFGEVGKNETITFDVGFNVQGCTVEAQQYGGWDGMSGDVPFQDMVQGKQPGEQASNRGRPPFPDWTVPISPSVYRNLTGVPQGEPGSDRHGPPCLNLGYLGRKSNPWASMGTSFSFSAAFGTWTNGSEFIPDLVVAVPDFTTQVRTFSLQDSLDSGGILHIRAMLRKEVWQGVVWVCAMPHRLALNGSLDTCPDGAVLTLNATATDKANREHVISHAYLPFPISGSWYLAMQSLCRGPQPCEVLPTVRLSVTLEQCAPTDCGRYGHCQMYTDANLVFSGCECFAGYRGLLCNDNTYSLTDGEQLRAVYLLTLSNLSFLPAIGLAVYRRYFTLAVVFFFNAFFSAFYHACDASHVFQTCILDYDTLAFCDFFGSVLSFYAVLLCMAKIPDSCRSFLLMIGALGIAVLQNSNRQNKVGHILPLGVAGFVLMVSWIMVMQKRKKLYPSRRRYLYFLLPGLVLAVTGIGVNYGFLWHHSTYQYTHSFWHFALMVTPCFLMPPRSRGLSGNKRGLSVSAQDIIRIGHHQQTEHLLGQQDDDEPAMFDASMNSIGTDQNRLI